MFVKFYDPINRTLRYVDHWLIRENDYKKPIKELYPRLRAMAGLPSSTELRLFDDCSMTQVIPIEALDDVEIKTGDILVFQANTEGYDSYDSPEVFGRFPAYCSPTPNSSKVSKHPLAAVGLSLWHTGNFADVKIHVSHETGQADYLAHRVMLSALPYFERLFLGNFADGKPKNGEQYIHVNIDGFRPEAVKTCLEYIYLGDTAIVRCLTDPRPPSNY